MLTGHKECMETILATQQQNQLKRRGKLTDVGKLPDKAKHGTSLSTAYHKIRELIVHGRISPGTWIVEDDLAKRLNMSRSPVRQAIHWLQIEGYLIEQRHVSKSRMIVSPLTKEDANALYLIIGRIEGLAGRGAALMPQEPRDELARKLRTTNEHLQEIANGSGNSTSTIFDLDRDFHRAIVQAGAGVRLSTIHNAIEPQAERYWRLYASATVDNLHSSLEEHDAIIASVLMGDPDGVEHALRTNWEKAAERLGQVIDIFGERGSW